MNTPRPLIDPDEIEAIIREARADRAELMTDFCRRLIRYVGRTATQPEPALVRHAFPASVAVLGD